ncbi:MAG: hypothetical protein LBG27_04020 [Spirochaetaceae bacterium]|jgi:hypothetical protein|nr:hypothetical protein [Spirochaetaceae bacterium]
MSVARITSWTDYVLAVKQMRDVQTLYFRTKIPMYLGFAKEWEAAVDEATERKLTAWGKNQDKRNKLPFEEEK